jgi:hypothetical protein
MRVRIFTRQGCPLCEKGIAAAVAVFGADNIELIDVDLDLALMERYTTRVPVIETLDGNVIAEGVIDKESLRE